MNRKKARQVNQETKKLNETIINNPPEPPPPSPPENGEPGEQYTAEDVAGIAEVLMDTYGYAYRQQCEIIGGIAQLDFFLGKVSNISPVFIIYNKDGNHWVVFTIIFQKPQEAVVLYKDSFGQPIPDDVTNLLKQRISHVDFKIHSGTEQVDSISCGPMALKNLEIMLKELKENQLKFIDDFERIKFCSQIEVKQLKLGFKAKILDKLLSALTQKATEEFKKALKEFIDICSKYGDISSSAQEYGKKLQEEADKQEKDPNHKINTELIEKSRQQFLARAQSLKQNKIADDKDQKIQLEIQHKFPIQMHIFTKIFRELAKINLNDEYEEVLRQISHKLDINFDKLKQFFEIQKTDLQKNNEEQMNNNKTKQKNLEELIKDIPAFSASKPDKASIKSFEELLIELKQLNNNETFEQLKKDYQEINKYMQTWKNKDISAVHYWAQTKKGNLKTEQFWEAIAVMSRGNELVTGGHQLRDTQILSVLAFIRRTKDYGKLCQIHTGEGKTTIVSLFATLKVLQGEKVDVVTSNQILAMEGKKSRENFYNLFDISVDTNNADESYNEGPRECYSSDVVYGSIGNFQFDYLKDSFEGLETRSKRGFSNVILDEVDSMLIDNGGYIAKLALPFPGMDSLKYVYVKIWQELFKAEHNLYKDVQEKLKIKSEELALNKIMSDKEKQFAYDLYLSELLENQINVLKCSIKASNPADVDLIPTHLVKYAKNMLDKWIDNAIYAKYQCRENEQYVIKEKDKENIIVPVDYQNTGVTLKNTIWSNGLHQFLQLKHNLHLTSETLTSSFISNIGYIKLYNNNIFGLTGTLGSLAEQQLLSKVYNVEYARIPTYKQKKFEEFGGIVIKDSYWTNAIALDSFFLARQGRSILIICKTIKDLREIEKNIEALKKIENFKYLNIKTYPDEDSSNVVDVEVGVSEVIIATNIAGRGTDFKTSMDLEENGGLHICVTFLPVNQRVEDQAFGRTARQGNFGTAQLIIKESDLIEIGVSNDIQKSGINFNKIKEIRDEIEKSRLKHVQDVDLQEINFQDTLFNKFSEMYRVFKNNQMKDGSKFYVVKDLKEYWAFWLQNKNFKGAELSKSMAEKEFELFKNDSRNILNGNIIFNPYYSIAQGEYFLSINKIPEAKAALEHAIQLSQDDTELLYSAYIKLFEVAIESGNQLRIRFYKALKETFFISENVLKIDQQYKENAKEYLIKAKKALEKELNYLKIYYFGGEEKDIDKNIDFRKILTYSENNLLVKHIKSRYIILNTFLQHIDSLLEQIGKETSEGIAIGARIPQYLNKLDPDKENEKELKSAITESELSELGLVGLDTIYALRTVHDVPKEIITRAQIQIGSGLSLLLTGLAFPPALPIVSPIAGTLISEGICDIVIELITKGFLQFDEAAYIKGKCISYGIAIATMGISAIVKSTTMLDAAIKACRKLSSILRKCKVFQSACEKLARILDKIAQHLEKIKLIVEFNRLGQVAQLKYLEKLKLAGDFDKLKVLGGIEKLVYLERLQKMGQLGNTLSRYQVFTTAVVKVGKETLQGVVGSIISEKIVTKVLEETLKSLQPKIRDKVSESIKRQINKNQLKSVKRENINSIVNELINGTHGEMAMDALKEIALGVMRHSKSWKVKTATVALESSILLNKIYNYTDEFCGKLKHKLAYTSDNIKNNETIINEIIESIIDQVTNNIYGIIMRLAGRFANTFVVNPIMNQGWNKLWGEGSEQKIELTQEDMEKIKSFAEIADAFETLNVPPNASEKEIKQAYSKALQKHHPNAEGRNDPNADENTRKIYKAYNLITNIQNKNNIQQPKGPLYLPPGPPTDNPHQKNHGILPETINNEFAPDATDHINQQKNLPVKHTEAKAHKGNIQTFAQVTQQYIIVRQHQVNGGINRIEIGKEFEVKDKPPVILDYFPPDGTHGGHYDIPEDMNIPVQSTGDNNCCYDSIAAQLLERGLDVSSEEIRQVAETPNELNAYYNQLVLITELTHNVLVIDNAKQVLGQCLVGGDKLFNKNKKRRPRRYIHGGVYPSGNIQIQVNPNGKNILKKLNNWLNQKLKEAKAFKQKPYSKKVGIIEKSFSIPVFGVSPEVDDIIEDNISKPEFMIGTLQVRFNNGKTLKLISLSGDAKFTTRLVVPRDQREGGIYNYPFESEDCLYGEDDFKFVSPIKITDHCIYDVANKKHLSEKYSKSCAAQRMFYELGEYMQEQLKDNPDLEVEDIQLAESWFKETIQESLENNQIIIEDSCPFCKDVLKLITGKKENEKEENGTDKQTK